MLFLEYISPVSTLLPIFVFLSFLLKRKELPIWVIFFYSLYSFTNDVIILYRDVKGLNYSIYLHIFTIIEYNLFSLLFYIIISNSIVKKCIVFLSIGFTGFCLYKIFSTNISKFDSVQVSIESILLIAYCIIYFYQQLNQPQFSFIYSKYTFWIVVALLISLSGTFFLYTFAMDLPEAERKNNWIISLVCTIFKNVLFTVAILIHVKKTKNTKSQNPVERDYQPSLN